MSKILKSLQFVTQSASPSTPGTGTGAIFASASSIYFENASGTVYDLAATNGYIVTQSYTGSTDGSDAVYIWKKPGTLKFLDIVCVGAGGGGAGGRCSVNAGQNGATGGGGGAIVWLNLAAAQLDSTYTITVGGGGAGGGSRVCTGITQTGTNGQPGGNTSFGNLVVAVGGDGGTGSITSGQVWYAAGGAARACTPPRGPWAITGCTSGNAGSTRATPGIDILDIEGFSPLVLTTLYQQQRSWGFGGGGGGCGSGTIGSTLYSSSDGSGVIITGSTVPAFGGSGQSVPGTNGGNGSDNKGLQLFRFTRPGTYFSSSYGLGTGGGGGMGTILGLTGGNGGNAGYYGAGGGGGGNVFSVGSAGTPVTTGYGGSGSSGLCLLIEYY